MLPLIRYSTSANAATGIIHFSPGMLTWWLPGVFYLGLREVSTRGFKMIELSNETVYGVSGVDFL